MGEHNQRVAFSANFLALCKQVAGGKVLGKTKPYLPPPSDTLVS